MAVTPEQWAAAAVDWDVTVDELRAKIDLLDQGDDTRKMMRVLKLPHDSFDRDGDPLTFGEWAVLYETASYRNVARTLLPNLYLIATMWTGLNEDLFVDPPTPLRTGVFHLADPDVGELPEPELERLHFNVDAALLAHVELVREYSHR